MKIILQKPEWLDDWFTIDRAHHERRTWFEMVESSGSVSFMDSAWISDACVEGSEAEMAEIAKAIKARRSVAFKRCAVRVDGGLAYFHSPKNSREAAAIPLADADEFADRVLAALLPPTADQAGADNSAQQNCPVVAWAHPDGRVVPAATKLAAERDGGAMRSSLAGYNIPLVAATSLITTGELPQGEWPAEKVAECKAVFQAAFRPEPQEGRGRS